MYLEVEHHCYDSRSSSIVKYRRRSSNKRVLTNTDDESNATRASGHFFSVGSEPFGACKLAAPPSKHPVQLIVNDIDDV